MKQKKTILLDGVSFRWTDEVLLITTDSGQYLISDPGLLFDFLAQFYGPTQEEQRPEDQERARGTDEP